MQVVKRVQQIGPAQIRRVQLRKYLRLVGFAEQNLRRACIAVRQYDMIVGRNTARKPIMQRRFKPGPANPTDRLGQLAFG